MSVDPSHSELHPSRATTGRTSFWRKLGGGSLSISLIVHAVLLALGVFWIFQVIPDKKPEPDFMPKGGGGGSPGVKEISNKKQRATMSTPNTPRMAAKGASSTFTLPEPDAASAMSSVGSLSSGGLSGGLGGSGSGGGRGDGHGKGFGSGSGPGLGGGAPGANPFGILPVAGAEVGMAGAFYDIKQTDKRKDTGVQPSGMPAIIRKFVEGNWRDSELREYYEAKQKLLQTKIYIPRMSADNAPAAFKCADEVKPSRWIVVYRGRVSPPKTAKYRFVGGADDVMVIRFNHKLVLDHGFTSGTTGLSLMSSHNRDVMTGAAQDDGVKKKLQESYPSKLPVTFYKYSSLPGWNGAIGGLAVGSEFEAREGNVYDMEILISEIPGGSFGACLLIEEVGAAYEKDSGGDPILPLFRIDSNLPEMKGEAPPFAKDGPVWKLVGKGGRPDI
ncbi:hypothetical protein KBB96_12735 [Luteolibacter ambystomatis]|uniref:PA14 domain-containing protein n=1 Tax=Luteolibacter ambystomatis TaxID=2824561 RepID=A0A975G6M7_9BACT|nr:hypothetical protein [Luteolibacter ambystomatis]QUE49736.1 hypothetical protein KBB96_12735 [Luteolibacter ambystomatis]